MNLDDFSTVVDDRRYINPQVAVDESSAFIQNLRDAQATNTAQIAADTYNLGTAIPSNLGGLGGSGSYFQARYQTPQTNALVADLETAMRAQGATDALNNIISQEKRNYEKAYKARKERDARRKAAAGRSNTGTPESTQIAGKVNFEADDGTPPENPGNPNVEDYIAGGYDFVGESVLPGQTGKYPTGVDTPTQSFSIDSKFGHIKDPIKRAQEWVNYLYSIGYGG